MFFGCPDRGEKNDKKPPGGLLGRQGTLPQQAIQAHIKFSLKCLKSYA
jgi:hypothetical protein